MAKPVNREPKRAYTKPVLTVYGTVRELTQHKGSNGAKDKIGTRAPAHTGA